MRRQTPEELRERQTPRGLLTHAKEFWRAANLIADQIGTDKLNGGLSDPVYHNPFYFLCGHSLELSMKASLLCAGRSHHYLKCLGHDLMKCYVAIKGCYPTHAHAIEEHSAIIDLLNESYSAKEFEYRMTGAKSWPTVSPLLYVVDDLYLVAEQIVADAEGRRA